MFIITIDNERRAGMIVVTGANGQLGGAIVAHLLTRTSPDDIGVSVRDVATAQPLAERGVRLRHGDFDDPSSLADAFEGADQVLIVSTDRNGPKAVAAHRRAIDAAIHAGVRRILYTSHMAASADSLFGPARDHAATEDHLAHTGVPFTSLRDGFHASSAAQMLTFNANDQTLAVPADGPVAWTDVDDLAEAAAVILTEEGMYDGPTPPLTAESRFTMSDVAKIAGSLGRPLTTEQLSDDDYRCLLDQRGLSDAGIDGALSFFLAARAGEFARTDPTLGRLLGRAPRTLAAALPALLERSESQWHG